MVNGARNSSIATFTVQEKKINVNGININHVITGEGNHPVLLLPGALGSVWTDFKPQLENLDKTKLTLVAWDPPGYGKSRPPDRTFPENFFERDACYAHDLMTTLRFSKFSLIGWSDGAITSLILAAKNPQNVQKLILLAANSYISPEEMKIYKGIMNIDTWSERMRAPLLAMYGEDYFRKTWKAWVMAMMKLYEKNNGDICKKIVSQIQSPTMIIHGSRDVIVAAEHPIYLRENILNSKLKIFENGGHNLHLRYHEEINKIILEFLTDN
ncbi:hypothetical protein PV326_004320 [Microctonus aethiopoides]|nr:hypothetical protein PV326_004320 [Microctonus aethiopoides]